MTNSYPRSLIRLLLGTMSLLSILSAQELLTVQAQEPKSSLSARTITGSVQNQDLRRVDQAIVQVRDQEGNVVTQGVTNQAGEFSVIAPQAGTYSVSAIHETYRREYMVVTVGTDKPVSVTLTLARTKAIALETGSPLPRIQC